MRYNIVHNDVMQWSNGAAVLRIQELNHVTGTNHWALQQLNTCRVSHGYTTWYMARGEVRLHNQVAALYTEHVDHVVSRDNTVTWCSQPSSKRLTAVLPAKQNIALSPAGSGSTLRLSSALSFEIVVAISSLQKLLLRLSFDDATLWKRKRKRKQPTRNNTILWLFDREWKRERFVVVCFRNCL